MVTGRNARAGGSVRGVEGAEDGPEDVQARCRKSHMGHR